MAAYYPSDGSAIVAPGLTLGGIRVYIDAYIEETSDNSCKISWEARVESMRCSQYDYRWAVTTPAKGTSLFDDAGTTNNVGWDFVTSSSSSGSFDVDRADGANQDISVSCYARFDSNTSAGGTATVTVTVPAKESHPQHLVSYRANGGEGGPVFQLKTYPYYLTLTSDIPTRTGYKFVGWATEAGSTTVAYSPGGAYEADADITLYAIWTPKATISILYDANGGAGAPSKQTTVPGVKIRLSSTTPTKTNCVFLGWQRLTGSDTTTVYRSGSEYSIGNYDSGDSISFHAVWYKIPAYVWANTGTSSYKGIYINAGTKDSWEGLYVSAE